MPAKSIARSLPGVPGRVPTPERGNDHRPCAPRRMCAGSSALCRPIRFVPGWCSGWGNTFRGHGPLLPQVAGISVGTGDEGATHGREHAEKAGFFCRSGPCPRTC